MLKKDFFVLNKYAHITPGTISIAVIIRFISDVLIENDTNEVIKLNIATVIIAKRASCLLEIQHIYETSAGTINRDTIYTSMLFIDRNVKTSIETVYINNSESLFLLLMICLLLRYYYPIIITLL